jgi:hypothetical protein
VNSSVLPVSSPSRRSATPKLALRLLGGLAFASLIGASCSGAGGLDGKVLVIDGAGITKAQFEDHLKGSALLPVPESANQPKTDTGAWAGGFVSDNLNNLMFATAIHAEHVAQKLGKPTRDPKIVAELTKAVGGAEAFKKIPKYFVDTQVNTQAEVEALYAAAAKKEGTPKEFLANHVELFAETCIKHILVASPEDAKRIRAELENGGDFAAIAKKESTDTGSGAQGGVLPCSGVQQFVPEFANAATKLKIGEISQPVQSQFGFHILSVLSRKTPNFADVEQSLPQALTQFSQNAVKDAVFKRLNNAKISVDSSIGTLDRSGEVPQFRAPSAKVLGGPALTNNPVG